MTAVRAVEDDADVARAAADGAGRPSYVSSMRPVARTRLFGREADLARLGAKIGAGARLVTLFGPAGIGKSALAVELARVAGDELIAVADLSEVSDRTGACTAISRALAVPLDPKRDPAEHLGAVFLARPRHVLVLDACDRAVEKVAALLRGWLVACPTAIFIVTSRELLGVPEEHAYEVGPLAVPAAGEHDSDAVRLFLARVEQTRHEALRSVDPEVIADIVRALEGIPLALELAAGRIAVLSPHELRERLTSRLSVLTSRLRPEHPRQRTMRAAIEWSWNLLEPHEQAALRQLSVFRGGFDAKGAEAVVDLTAHRGAPPVLDVLQSLRAKSFIRGDERADDVRLHLYEIIRELGSEALADAGEERAAIARHATHFVALCESWGAAVGTPREAEALAALSTELDNLRAVHARALTGLTSNAADDAFRVLVHLESVMGASLPAHALLALVDRALASELAAGVPSALRCEVLLRRARTLQLMGRHGASESAAEALALARSDGNARLEGSALARLGSIDMTGGEVRRGSERLRSAVALLVEHDPRRAADALTTLGTSLRTLGDVEEARMAHEEALGIRARLGDERGAALDLACLAALHYQQGQLEQARRLLEDAIVRSTRMDDRYARAYAVGVFASVLAELGKLDEARERYDEAIEQLDKLGDRRLYAGFMGYSAVVCQLAGALPEASERYQVALGILRDQGDRLHEGLFAGAAATLAWTRDQAEEAEALFVVARDRLTELSGAVSARLPTVLTLHLGHRDLWLQRNALRGGDDRAARQHLDAARARLARAGLVVDDHDDLRMAHRLLQKAALGELPARESVADIDVGPGAVWFKVGWGPRVDLRRRRAPRLVFAALVAERTRAPGVPISMSRLIEIGWPGEKIRTQAGLSRLYVTIRSLRELGLRSTLLRQDDGYLLDPTTMLGAAALAGESP